MGHRVTVHCPAKVNLGLEVLHRRGDGYHEICTVMQAIDLYDELTLEVLDGDGSEAPQIEVSGPFTSEVPENGNTLLVAWAIAGGNKLPALKVNLVKNIPAGAGLGGGSSDGAAMLVGLREVKLLGSAGASPVNLQATGGSHNGEHGRAIVYPGSSTQSGTLTGEAPALPLEALRIGSDCPFFLSGGTQLAEGRGEHLSQIERKLDFHLVVAVPHFGSATGPSYAALNRTQQPMAPMLVPQLARSLTRGDMNLFKASVINDFEPVFLQRHPDYLRWFEKLNSAGAFAVSLTGSGSGFFGVFAESTSAEAGLAALAPEPLRYLGLQRPIRH